VVLAVVGVVLAAVAVVLAAVAVVLAAVAVVLGMVHGRLPVAKQPAASLIAPRDMRMRSPSVARARMPR